MQHSCSGVICVCVRARVGGCGLPGTGSLSSCNYVARTFGLKNGMWMAGAKQKCPELVVIPFEFDLYLRLSNRFYDIVTQPEYGGCVEVVSCDEAYLDITAVAAPIDATGHAGTPPHSAEGTPTYRAHASHGGTAPTSTGSRGADDRASPLSGGTELPTAAAVVHALRQRVLATTGLTCSAGVASNKLLARMCTKCAKPNGHKVLPTAEVAAFLVDKPVSEIPNVGHRMRGRLEDVFGITHIAQLQQTTVAQLCAEFGPVKGRLLHDNAHGKDPGAKPVATAERESVSVEVCLWRVLPEEENEIRCLLYMRRRSLSSLCFFHQLFCRCSLQRSCDKWNTHGM